MEIKSFLPERRAAILRRWFDLILEGYPGETSLFMKEECDRFANPVGAVISQGIEVLFDELTGETDSGSGVAALDSIIRIRAVQEMGPQEALSFVLLLKEAVRAEAGERLMEPEFFSGYLLFDSRIDALVLSACDLYVKARAEVSRARVREIAAERDRVMRILRMMGREEVV